MKMLLGQYFAMDVLGHAAKKRLFGGGYTVPSLSVVFASITVFQKGALLAYARADQYERLCALISDPGGESGVAEVTRNIARENWNMYGANSKSLTDYILRSEFPKSNFGDMAMLQWMSKQKMRLGETFDGLQISTANGMGFGVTFPDVFRTMWENSYEHPDAAKWARAVEAGVDIPSTPDILPLRDAVKSVLRETAEYARDYCPHLVAELKLDAAE
jgi:hypothetical protein